MKNIIKSLTLTIIFLILSFFIFPQVIKAACQNQPEYFECGSPKPNDTCDNTGNTASGTTYYSYSSYYQTCGGPGYYHHDFNCDTPCGAPGVPGGGGGVTYPTCTTGKALTPYSPMGTLNSNQCTFLDTCYKYFPSLFAQTGCNGQAWKGRCDVSYLCCNPGQEVSCTGTAITRQAYGCLAGEVKLSAWTTSQVIDGETIFTPYVSCKRGCSCVTPCVPAKPSAPVLTTPLTGAVVTNTTLTLDWNPVSSWGTACTGANNTYRVRVGTVNPPGLVAIVPSTRTNYVFTGVAGNRVGQIGNLACIYEGITAIPKKLHDPRRNVIARKINIIPLGF